MYLSDRCRPAGHHARGHWSRLGDAPEAAPHPDGGGRGRGYARVSGNGPGVPHPGRHPEHAAERGRSLREISARKN